MESSIHGTGDRSWCMGIIAMVSWVGRDGGGGWHACGTKPGAIGHMSGDAGALPEC